MKKEIVVIIALFCFSLIPDAYAQGGCGNGVCSGQETCSSCPEDCGACPTTTTTPTAPAAVLFTPITMVPQSPTAEDTIKRGALTLLAKGFVGEQLDSGISVTAASDLFGSVQLTSNFGGSGHGIYGTNVTIGRDAEKGRHAINITGSKGSIDVERFFVNLDPAIYMNTTIQNYYSKGQRINFAGRLTYFDGSPVKNANMLISISATLFTFKKAFKSNSNGEFNYSYFLSFAEPDGVWDINVLADDADGNEGSAQFSPLISTPEGVQYYTVSFLSPLKDAEFKRGSRIPITVEVSEAGSIVGNATVDFKTLQGDTIKLAEGRPGVYSAEYATTFFDPLGTWNIAVGAIKTENGTVKAGGNKIPVSIMSADLKLAASPAETRFFTGQRIEIKAELSYPDGVKVEDANVIAKIGNETVELTEKSAGVYANYFLFTEASAGTSAIQVRGADLYGNVIEAPLRPILVQSVSPVELALMLFYFNVVLRYWYVYPLLIGVVVAGTRRIWYAAYLKARLGNLAENIKRTVEMEKDAQMKYFKHRSISKGDYDRLMQKYRVRMSDLNEMKLKINKSLEELRPTLKKLKRRT